MNSEECSLTLCTRLPDRCCSETAALFTAAQKPAFTAGAYGRSSFEWSCFNSRIKYMTPQPERTTAGWTQLECHVCASLEELQFQQILVLFKKQDFSVNQLLLQSIKTNFINMRI